MQYWRTLYRGDCDLDRSEVTSAKLSRSMLTMVSVAKLSVRKLKSMGDRVTPKFGAEFENHIESIYMWALELNRFE